MRPFSRCVTSNIEPFLRCTTLRPGKRLARTPRCRTVPLCQRCVLPALRTTKAVADHVRQYFRDTHRPLIETASGLASAGVFRPILSQVVRQGVFAMAGRFIAGATPEEAIPTLRELADEGVSFSV